MTAQCKVKKIQIFTCDFLIDIFVKIPERPLGALLLATWTLRHSTAFRNYFSISHFSLLQPIVADRGAAVRQSDSNKHICNETSPDNIEWKEIPIHLSIYAPHTLTVGILFLGIQTGPCNEEFSALWSFSPDSWPNNTTNSEPSAKLPHSHGKKKHSRRTRHKTPCTQGLIESTGQWPWGRRQFNHVPAPFFLLEGSRGGMPPSSAKVRHLYRCLLIKYRHSNAPPTPPPSTRNKLRAVRGTGILRLLSIIFSFLFIYNPSPFFSL